MVSRISLPSLRAITLSAIMAASTEWVTITTVMPRSSTKSLSSPITVLLDSTSRLPVGSSAKTTEGLCIITLAIAVF